MKTTSFQSGQVPFLPGTTYADPTIQRYHKTQLFGVNNGLQTGKSTP